MRKVNFTKMVASGNDFVVIEVSPQTTVHRPQNLSMKICDRKFGAGADGMLLLEKSKTAGLRMRIFNADGSEARMCGNGARCAALYIRSKVPATKRGGSAKVRGGKGQRSKVKIKTKAGMIDSEIKGSNVLIKLTEPKGIRLDIPVKINNRSLKVNFINTGVPHTVIFVEGIEGIDVSGLGRAIRYHRQFAPAGTNVDFVQVEAVDTIRVRTYERGVEDETLACGTGSVASALVYALKSGVHPKINVRTAGGETLKVYFERCGNNFKNVWLEGLARIVYTGVYHV